MIVFTDVTDALSRARRREAAEFAALLEAGRVPAGNHLAALVGLARSLAPAEHSPAPDFRTALRARLVTEAASRVPVVPAQRSPRTHRPARTRLRYAAATVAMASVVTGVGAAAASTNALPGDALYDLKLRIESAQLWLADSDLERGRELLQQADSRLGEVERLAASSTAGEPATRRELARTLTQMEQATAAGAAALTDSYRDTGDPEPMLLLDRFVAQQQVRLGDLLMLLDPGLRARVQAAADALEVIGGRTGAVLASASSRDDGWATSRLADRGVVPPGAATGTGADPVGDAVGGGVSSGGSLAPGGTTTGSDPTGTGLGSGGVPTVVPTPAAPPTVGPLPPPPLPTVAPPTATPPVPTVAVPTPTPPVVPVVPAPSCVAVPPLTSC